MRARSLASAALLGATLAATVVAPAAWAQGEAEKVAETVAAEVGEEAHGEHGGGHHKAEPPPPVNLYQWHYGKDILGGKLDPGEEPMPPGLLFALINFAVFVTLLVKFAGPKLVGYLRGRHDLIKTQLDEASRLRAEARAKLDEYNRRIAGIDEEVSKLMHEIRAEAEAERDSILAQARTQAEAMKRDAQARIESEIARARYILEREVVSAAVAAAEKVLAERTTPDDQSRLFDGFIANLVAGGGDPGPGGEGGSGKRARRGTVDEEWGQ